MNRHLRPKGLVLLIFTPFLHRVVLEKSALEIHGVWVWHEQHDPLLSLRMDALIQSVLSDGRIAREVTGYAAAHKHYGPHTFSPPSPVQEVDDCETYQLWYGDTRRKE